MTDKAAGKRNTGLAFLTVFLCGILTASPLLFPFLAFLPWFSMVPLFYLALRCRRAYRLGICFSLGYYGVVYYWFIMLYPLDFAGFTPAASVGLIAFAWIGMSLMQGIGTAFVPFLFRRLQPEKRILLPFTAAALWCVMEWAQNLFWFGVPWARLAVTQYKALPVIQSASLFGSLFVGFLMVLCNGFLTLFAGELMRDRLAVFRSLKKTAPALTAVLLVLTDLAFGWVRLSAYREGGKTVSAACIQGNIASGDKWADDSVENALRIYSELTRKAAAEGAEVILWPETVLTVSLNLRPDIESTLCRLAKETGACLWLGAFYAGFDGDGRRFSQNAVYLFRPDGTVYDGVYAKRHPVPFGEYLPMEKIVRKLIPFLGEINMFSDPLTPGTDSELFDTPFGKFGALVCFDSIYSGLCRDSTADGAEIILLSTNDSWYRDSAAVYQHNGHAVLRAVENGRCIIRAANTGISSLITGSGEITASLPPLVTGYITGQVSLRSDRTLYNRVGDLIVWCSMGYLLAVAVLTVIRKRKKTKV